MKDTGITLDADRSPRASSDAPVAEPSWARRHGRAILVLGVVIGGGCGAAAYVKMRPSPVTVTPVVRGKAIEAVYATGSVEAEDRVLVRTKASGSISELLVREGTAVRRGELLARIDNPTVAYDLQRGEVDRGAASAMAREDSPQVGALRAQAEAIRADLTIARQDVERAASLAKTNSIALVELDRTRARVAQLEATLASNAAQQRALRIDLTANAARQDAQVKSLTSRVTDTEVRSPMDGVVLTKTASLGELVTANQVLFKIGDTKSLVLELSVDEADVARVIDGKDGGGRPSEVAVSLYAFPKQAFHGRVFEVMPDANRERKAFLTKVRITDPPKGLRSGMSAEVNIIAGKHEGVLLVATGAEADGNVWVVEDGRARRRAVTTGIRDLLRVEIESGLAERELVVVDGLAALREGARVSTTVREPDKYLAMPDLAQPVVQTSVK